MKLPTAIALVAAPFAVADEKEAVAATFRGYKQAIIAQNGAEATGWVTKSTLDEYQTWVQWARSATRKEVEALPFASRIQVLMIRHRVDAATLREADGGAIFALAVDRDWTGKAGVNRMELGEVEVKDDKATGKCLVSGKQVGMDFEFLKENGKWRIDLSALTKLSGPSLQAAVAQSGVAENTFILQMLEKMSGKRPAESIWDPVR
jgi:hypothetical protein